MGEQNGKKEPYPNKKSERGMEIKVRDLSLSREKWKEKAIKLEASLKEKEFIIEELKKKLANRGINQK